MLKLIRLALGSIIAFFDWLTRGSKLKRDSKAQEKVEQELKKLSIYQFKLCPFCIKTRRALHKLNLPIKLEDAKNDPAARDELLNQGGKIKVPCLRIEENNQVKWMYESNDIIHYLTQRFQKV
ncbi:glutathione S-transferase N-terminal domain-containing protein [Aliikangiella sp. IMCC44359]|uniref:glutathione S-transferase N-terminal domain-containing protein n=1 Tax=Aliikangiella sp. IMCC44359 TaxID=3459125 RepID=UPI00403B1B61